MERWQEQGLGPGDVTLENGADLDAVADRGRATDWRPVCTARSPVACLGLYPGPPQPGGAEKRLAARRSQRRGHPVWSPAFVGTSDMGCRCPPRRFAPLRGRVSGGPDGVLVVDETGFLKKGQQSAGVARQYRHSGSH